MGIYPHSIIYYLINEKENELKMKSRRFNKNAPKAKTHKPKKGKGAYQRFKDWLKERL